MSEKKLVSVTVPCYNSAEYMDRCVKSIIVGARKFLDEIEIIIVDDGSTDETGAIADNWQKQYPGVVRSIHQKNAGHGGAVNTGLRHARGKYFKVVDSDDWLDRKAWRAILAKLKKLDVDLLLSGYTYYKEGEKPQPMGYKGIIPSEEIIDWSQMKRPKLSRYILMHSAIYRTELLRKYEIKLPKHTFYVDNIFVYVPLPYVRSIYYMNNYLYCYAIGREDQSVNEKVMISRLDQQIRITRIMIDAHDFSDKSINRQLLKYMKNYLSMMMAITTILCYLSKEEDSLEQKKEIWQYLREKNPSAYAMVRPTLFGFACHLPGWLGHMTLIAGYRVARQIWKFN